jgi:two-component system, OmpR family, sensor histidine kinase BaeS
MKRWRITFTSSLSGKFLLSYLLIVLVSVATLLAVVFALAPALFQSQLVHVLQTHPEVLTTAEASQRILEDLLGILFSALVVAAIVATVTSLIVSLFVTRRITGPLRQMTQISQRISAGHYAERITIAPVHATDELGQLASSINRLAVALEQTDIGDKRSLAMWHTNCAPPLLRSKAISKVCSMASLSHLRTPGPCCIRKRGGCVA